VPWRLCNQAAKASGFTQSRRASAPEDPVSPQPTAPAGYPAAYFGNATSGRANGNARRPPRSIDNFGSKARER